MGRKRKQTDIEDSINAASAFKKLRPEPEAPEAPPPEAQPESEQAAAH